MSWQLVSSAPNLIIATHTSPRTKKVNDLQFLVEQSTICKVTVSVYKLFINYRLQVWWNAWSEIKIRTLNISSDLLPEFLVWQANMFLTSRERRCLSSPQIQLITAQTTAACRTWWTVSGIVARCYCELWNHISNVCFSLLRKYTERRRGIQKVQQQVDLPWVWCRQVRPAVRDERILQAPYVASEKCLLWTMCPSP